MSTLILTYFQEKKMTLTEVVKALQDRRIDSIAAETGLSRNTISNIRNGANNNPTIDTINALAAYLKKSCSVGCLSDK
jgi:transcriptional regulator with XRE-family HTH domain